MTEREKKKKAALSAREKMPLCATGSRTEALAGRVTGVYPPRASSLPPALLTGHEPEAMRRYRAMLTMMSDEATAAKLDELQKRRRAGAQPEARR